jgi:carbon monoxide dehydrogenase subunit G
MATLHEEIRVAAPADRVWDAVRDVGALHTRLVPGFVVDTKMEGTTRVVTFGNGMTVREPIVSIDDARRRLAWTATGGRATHYNAVMEVVADGDASRVIWTIDLLPDEVAPTIATMQRQGLATLKKTWQAP